MSESELDSLYTQLCQTMTDIGETQTPLFLARFALLSIIQIEDATVVQRLIAEASDGIDNAALRTASAAPT